MLSTRWTAHDVPDSSETHCSLVAVQLTLRSRDAAPVVDTWVRRIADGPGARGLLGLMVQRTDTHMRMVSAWVRRSQLAEFQHGPLHHAAKQALRAYVLPPTVVVWTQARAALPPDWHEVQQRLDDAFARQQQSSSRRPFPPTHSIPSGDTS